MADRAFVEIVPAISTLSWRDYFLLLFSSTSLSLLFLFLLFLPLKKVRNAVSSVTSMFPDVPTEVKAYLPDTNGITLPDVQFSDIPTSQVQFTVSHSSVW